MKRIFIIVYLGALLFCACKEIPKTDSMPQTNSAPDPIVGTWARGGITTFFDDGTYIQKTQDGEIYPGKWRRVAGTLWRFKLSDATLRAVNANEMFAPLISSYTLAESKPDDEGVGTWSSVERGGFYQIPDKDGYWPEAWIDEDGQRYESRVFTVDGDRLIESMGDYSNHYKRLTPEEAEQIVAGNPLGALESKILMETLTLKIFVEVRSR